MSTKSSHDEPADASNDIGVVLHSRGYLALLMMASLLGIPLSVLAFSFLVTVHELEHLVWETLPAELGFDELPAWWPIGTLGLAGVLVALVVRHLPGHGGHVPVMGLGDEATPPVDVLGVALAAGASLVLGAVLGPEAPLIAIGGGLALLAVNRMSAAVDASASSVLAIAGSAAAISAIFGSPLVAAIMILEVAGLARRRALLVVLPCLLSSGVGALLFTGLGNWTGFDIGALTIPDLEAAGLERGDLILSLPVAAVVAFYTWAVFGLGRRMAALANSGTGIVTVAAGLVAGGAAALYSVLVDRSPVEVALSGQATLPALATQPGEWSAGALVLLLLCKGVAYGLCLGVFRGGAVFPAIFLGAAAGVLASTWLPGLGTVAGLAVGMAAGSAAATRLPITSVVLVVLLLGGAASDLMPVLILAAVTALVIDELLTSSRQAPQR